ncbi:DUF397 domain-containing protein [Streptomyces rectiverticillatus]|uniref:DUF397 domain-containing protein n=1 Tax=Streptomyces rectiverticillatus TaxID=173860 RepID=UPI0015C39B3B|nr:DUF397 domain-containing protein [Streptomyces rectiverticillatus]QLE73440.1 DUF397 domain-containing protein [Streptomyces rectiverticillatus]
MRSNHDLGRAVWRKSSYSNGGDGTGGGSCLEVSDDTPGIVPVRDSKTPNGPVVAFEAAAWSAFINRLKA